MLGKPCNELWFNNDQSLIMTMTFYAKIKITVRIGLCNTVKKMFKIYWQVKTIEYKNVYN